MKILVIAPHPDDEGLGCGGALLRLMRERPDAELHWVIVTEMPSGAYWSEERASARRGEIAIVAERLKVREVHQLRFPAARLDTVPMADLVAALSAVMTKVEPDTVFIPYRHDVHTDHRYVFDAASACVKSFRYPSVRTVLAYETLSETEFGLDPSVGAFRPNVWVDISQDLEAKIELLGIYAGEMGAFPFPRSREAVEALARVRGATAGVPAAEGFILLKSVI